MTKSTLEDEAGLVTSNMAELTGTTQKLKLIKEDQEEFNVKTIKVTKYITRKSHLFTNQSWHRVVRRACMLKFSGRD